MTLVDLRLVPAALTSWAVTGSGICWSWRGALIAAAAAVGVTATTGWWAGSRDRRRKPDLRAVSAGAAAVALVGFGFAVAVGLRADHARTHPVTQYFGRSTTVIVTPTETPRILTGGRVMFRATLVQLDGARSGGRVVVFASGSGYADLVVGQPAAFRTGVSHPIRRDLTVAVLAARGPPTRGQPAPVHQVAHRVRAAFAQAARLVLDTDQAAVLPALVLGDTSAVPAPVTAQFRVAGLTHLTAVSGANVTIVCGAVLLSAALVGPRIAVLLAAVALLGFVVVVQPSASVLRAAVMAAITLLAVVTRRRRQVLPALAATVVGLMVAAPELAVDAGFALSVSATAALVVAPAERAGLAATTGRRGQCGAGGAVGHRAAGGGTVRVGEPGGGDGEPARRTRHTAHHRDRHRSVGVVSAVAGGGAAADQVHRAAGVVAAHRGALRRRHARCGGAGSVGCARGRDRGDRGGCDCRDVALGGVAPA